MQDINIRNEYTKVAYYYYKLGMTQDEIAKKMSTSRQRVNRILKKCLETGIVKIVIQEYDNQNVDLEIELETLLGLNEMIIVNNADGEINEFLGAAASSYLERVLKANDIIGFSRGRALSSLVQNLRPMDKKNLTVTQLVGGLNADESHINSDYIVAHSSEVLNAKPCFMYAPIILENKKLRDSLMNESFFSSVYDVMKSCTIAIVGIGDMSDKSNFVQKNFISKSESYILQSKNAVGEICTHYFDVNGKIIDSGLNDRVLSIDLQSYKSIPIRIGVGCGPEKLSSILGAARGELINVLITDFKTAQALSEML
ncbi:sugar-binding transcriptional regulator [Clostridium swellfunianum]|uniref:sugar-binding transcriptional regulator n=1 Tax=Clostridium swellfunianum TaxID=1367462 RepID=UPI002030F764|nr:sugar-binding transcriptional regulator [Clostridium swellfunianum]